MRVNSLPILLGVVLGAIPIPAATAQSSSAAAIVGSWTMEDAYTLHVDDPTNLRIESHEEGRFTVDLIVYRDGTGVLGATGFSWSVAGDAVVWRFPGRTLRILPRPIDEDTVLILALVEGDISGGSVISVMRRMPPPR
jgi:hypothetical protein